MSGGEDLTEDSGRAFAEEVNLLDVELVERVQDLGQDGVECVGVWLLPDRGGAGQAVAAQVAPDDAVVPRQGGHPVVEEG